jgi:hypothetical protein
VLARIPVCVLAVYASGCGLLLDIGLDDADAASTHDAAGADAALDAGVDAAAGDGGLLPRCVVWSAFEAPEELVEVNSAAVDYSPSLTADMLEIYFASARDGGEDLWVARRRSVADPFDAPVRVEELNTEDSEQDPDIRPDGLEMFFSRSGGGIWQAQRAARGEPFGPAVRLEIAFAVEAPTSYGGPSLAADGSLYFSVGPYSPPDHDLWIAKVTAGMLAGGPLLSTSDHEGFPSISSAGLDLYFDARRAGEMGLWVVRRRDTTVPFVFDEATQLFETTFPGYTDQDPDISPDGSTLCFDVDTGSGGLFDIWCAQRTCTRFADAL